MEPIKTTYIVVFPNGDVWGYFGLQDLEPHSRAVWRTWHIAGDEIVIPVDLVTAVNLGIVRQEQKPPVPDIFWAWLKLTNMVKSV